MGGWCVPPHHPSPPLPPPQSPTHTLTHTHTLFPPPRPSLRAAPTAHAHHPVLTPSPPPPRFPPSPPLPTPHPPPPRFLREGKHSLLIALADVVVSCRDVYPAGPAVVVSTPGTGPDPAGTYEPLRILNALLRIVAKAAGGAAAAAEPGVQEWRCEAAVALGRVCSAFPHLVAFSAVCDAVGPSLAKEGVVLLYGSDKGPVTDSDAEAKVLYTACWTRSCDLSNASCGAQSLGGVHL